MQILGRPWHGVALRIREEFTVSKRMNNTSVRMENNLPQGQRHRGNPDGTHTPEVRNRHSGCFGRSPQPQNRFDNKASNDQEPGPVNQHRQGERQVAGRRFKRLLPRSADEGMASRRVYHGDGHNHIATANPRAANGVSSPAAKASPPPNSAKTERPCRKPGTGASDPIQPNGPPGLWILCQTVQHDSQSEDHPHDQQAGLAWRPPRYSPVTKWNFIARLVR